MRMEGDDSDLVLRLIRHACVAGSLRLAAEAGSDAKSGLVKAAQFHSQRVRVLAGQLVGGAELDPAPPSGSAT